MPLKRKKERKKKVAEEYCINLAIANRKEEQLVMSKSGSCRTKVEYFLLGGHFTHGT